VAQQLQLAAVFKLRRRRGKLRRDGVEREREERGVLRRVQQLDGILDGLERAPLVGERWRWWWLWF
jgi:hypothetical protein